MITNRDEYFLMGMHASDRFGFLCAGRQADSTKGSNKSKVHGEGVKLREVRHPTRIQQLLLPLEIDMP